jgi:hypothetical protein
VEQETRTERERERERERQRQEGERHREKQVVNSIQIGVTCLTVRVRVSRYGTYA